MIKNIFLGILLFGSFLFSDTKIEYHIALIGMKMDYREYDREGDILDSEKSNFNDVAGGEIAYKYFLDENSNINFTVMGVSGNTQYAGSYIGSGLGYGSVVSTTSNTVYDVALGYNAQNMSSINVLMLGGVGMGYRYWQRELSVTQAEEYIWYSLRANIGMQYVYNAMTTSLIAEYQYGIKPEMRASGFDENFQLASANIVKLSVPIRYTVNQNFDLICTYVFEYQEIKESNVVYDSTANGYVEPDSTAYNQYLKVGIIFKY